MLKYLKGQWGPRVCSWVPLALWHQLVPVELLVPHWHVASNENLPHIRGLYQYRTLQQFKADLDFFLQSYTPVSLTDVLCHLNGGRALPKRCFLATFDDGFREIHDTVAPILYSKGVPAAFFLITSAIDNDELCYPQKKSLLLHALNSQRNSAAVQEISQILVRAEIGGSNLEPRIRGIYYRQRHVLDEIATVLGCDFQKYVSSVQPYLTSAQVANLMNMGFAIGAHSVDHPLYAELNIDEQVRQTEESLSWLSQRFGYECQSFAFPYQDTGVSLEYFQRAYQPGNLKVSFGIGGLCDHFYPRNLPRFSMERTDLPAAQILARQLGRALLHRN